MDYKKEETCRFPQGANDAQQIELAPEVAERFDRLEKKVDRLYTERRREAAPEPMLDKTEAAEVLGVSPRTLDTLLAAGEIASIKVRRCRRIRPADLRTYIDRRAAGEGRADG